MAYNPSDLNSVLSTLSALTSNNNKVNINGNSNNNDDDDDYSYDYEPPESVQSVLAPTPVPVRKDAHIPAEGARNRRKEDPSEITTWPRALQHVMRAVAANETTQHKIRRLIHNQHSHERQWWAGREALLRKQGSRETKRAELERVLQSAGVPIRESDPTSILRSASEDQAELRAYDTKVYKASMEMAAALATELEALGIPFFSTKRSYIRGAREDGSRTSALTDGELNMLQRRMLDLLQDLCKE